MMCTWQAVLSCRWNVRGQRSRTPRRATPRHAANYVATLPSCVAAARVCQGGLITSLELPYKLSRDEPSGVRNGARSPAFVEVSVMVNRPRRLIDILRRKIPPAPRPPPRVIIFFVSRPRPPRIASTQLHVRKRVAHGFYTVLGQLWSTSFVTSEWRLRS